MGLELLMDIEMLNKFLKVVISAVILSASGYANIASADLVYTPPSLTSFQWSATCFDCDYDDMGKRPLDDGLYTNVQGTISLLDYEFGDEISLKNFSSFVYSGKSRWLPTFAVGSSPFEGLDYVVGEIGGSIEKDGTFNLSLDASLLRMTSMVEAKPTVNEIPDLPQGIFISINTDGFWDITAYKPKIQPLCQGNDFWDPEVNMCVNEEKAPPIREEPKFESPVVKLDLLDFGKDFVLSGFETNNKGPVGEVPEPSTLAIFALGLMGLGLRRFKKQS
jgi:hypothetical protein